MIADAGDLVWCDFTPTLGTEKSGRSPALSPWPRAYNIASGRSIVCPVSSTTGDWARNLPPPGGLGTRGVVLVDHVRVEHNESRLFRLVERVPDAVLTEVRARLAPLLAMN